MIKLPVDEHLIEIKAALAQSEALVIQAPPGTGKTTRVPAYLAFDLGLRTIVLEPRRIAARQSAMRVASERGLTHGVEVGHAFRHGAKWTSQTQLLFATEGTFLNLFEKNAYDFDVVIIDEFHERHLDGDFALALLSAGNKKIVVMSATLQGLDLEGHFRNLQKTVAVIDVQAPLFHCEIRYLPNVPSVLSQSLESKVISVLSQALSFGGDILVFLPGVREIESVHAALERLDEMREELSILELHGRLDIKTQSQVFEKSAKTKVILATNVAESSLTVPGVRVVIDCGVAKEMQWSPWSRVSQLKEVKIAKSNAIQRTGRAIREADGLCFRLYAELDFESRDQSVRPEIERVGLEAIMLRYQQLGAPACHWFCAPNEKAWSEALVSLCALGAYDEEKKELSILGKKMAQIPLEPEWARAALELDQYGERTRRNFVRFLARRSLQSEQQLRELLGRFLSRPTSEEVDLGRILLPGFIRSLGRVRAQDVVSSSGALLKISPRLSDQLHEGDWGLILEVDARDRVQDFVVIDSDWIYELSPLPITEKRELSLDPKRGLLMTDRLSVGALSLEESTRPVELSELPEEFKEQARELLAKKNERLLSSLKVGDRWQRLVYLYQYQESSLDLLSEDLALFSSSGFEFDQTSFFSFLEMRALERWGVQIDRELPLKIGELQVTYDEVSGPFLMAYIQFFFGLKETPVLPLTGKPLLLKLQGPHKRPLQLTSDLAGFWKRGYQELLKEMRREYPRHHWPDEPWLAPPVLLKRQL